MADSQPSRNRLISLSMWASIAAIGAVVVLGAWLRMGIIGTTWWPIEWLEVSGELQRTSASQVRATAAPLATGGFFATDLDRIRDEVERLPWIAEARIMRVWPDTLRMTLREHQPVARWNESGVLSGATDQGGALLSIDGSEGIQGLVRLYGPDGRHDEVLRAWREMRPTLAQAGLHVDSLALDERGAWTVSLTNGIELLLGREQRQARLARFVAVHDHLRQQDRRAARVDMRYANGMAVEWINPNREQQRRG